MGDFFRLHSIENEYKDQIVLEVESFDFGSNNYHTVITGENGCGKSSLLAKSANAFIFSSNSHNPPYNLSFKSTSSPEKVIAICNSRYNRFALKKTFMRSSNKVNPSYYTQVDHNLEIGKSVLSVVRHCLKEIIISPQTHNIDNRNDINKAFEMIGISPKVTLRLKFDQLALGAYLKVNNQEKKESLTGEEFNILQEVEVWKKHINAHDDSLLKIMTAYLDRLPATKTISLIEFDVSKGAIDTLRSDFPDFMIQLGIIVGFIVPTDIQVQTRNSSKWVSNHALSSGQQALMLTAFIISTITVSNCLICIDEPENSLHPAWQLEYMEFLKLLMTKCNGCHVIIATHSPQIISGMKNSKGSIVSLYKDAHNLSPWTLRKSIGENPSIFNRAVQDLRDSKYFERQSTDKQLTEIFHTPGFKNDFIIRTLLVILSKIVNDKKINDKDLSFIYEMDDLINSRSINEGDPAKIIIAQVKSLITLDNKK